MPYAREPLGSRAESGAQELTQLHPLSEGPHLGVNIDHVATLRQLRGTPYPDLVEAARLVEAGGGQQITVHLREDRRHIQDSDVKRLRSEIRLPLNLEMAATAEMVRFACRIGPDWACLVPEKRQELTTEGGLDVNRGSRRIVGAVAQLRKVGIRVSLFIEPTVDAVRRSHELGVDAVELHTGRYAQSTHRGPGARKAATIVRESDRIRRAATLGRKLGLIVNAGHGLDYENVRSLAALTHGDRAPLLKEFNIGHSIVCRAAIVGLERAVREMVAAIQAP